MDKTKREPKEILIVEEVEESFTTWANQPFILPETRQSILKSNLLIIPMLGFRDLKIPVFPVCTEELFNFIKEASPAGITPDICIEDKEYKELALHSALLVIGGFVVTALAAPILADLISEYIKRRTFKENENKVVPAKHIILKEENEEDEIMVALTVVEESGKALKFNYEGPAKDFRKTINAALKAPVIKNRKTLSAGANPAKGISSK